MDTFLREFFGVGADDDAVPQEAAGSPDSEREQARQAKREARKADPAAAAKRNEFAERYQSGDPAEGITAEEALEHLQDLQDELSPAEFRKAMEDTLNNLPADQRDDFVALMQQHKAATAGDSPAAPPAVPLGGMLGGLLGGRADAANTPSLGDVLNDLRQGGLNAPAPAGGGKPTEQDFLQLINSPLGRAVLGGLATYGMKQLQQQDTDQEPRP